MAETLHSQYRGPGFYSWLGNWTVYAATKTHHSQINKYFLLIHESDNVAPPLTQKLLMSPTASPIPSLCLLVSLTLSHTTSHVSHHPHPALALLLLCRHSSLNTSASGPLHLLFPFPKHFSPRSLQSQLCLIMQLSGHSFLQRLPLATR